MTRRDLVAAALLAVAVVAGGCGLFGAPAPNQPQLDVFECQLDALKAAVPPAVAEDLVMAVRARNYEYVVRQLLALGLDRDRIAALGEALDACAPAPEPPPPEAS